MWFLHPLSGKLSRDFRTSVVVFYCLVVHPHTQRVALRVPKIYAVLLALDSPNASVYNEFERA